MLSKMGSEGFVKLLMSLIFSWVLYSGGMIAYQQLQSKAAMQVSVNESIDRWKQSYMALQSVAKEWKIKYKPAASVPDIRAVIALIGLPSVGLESDTDNLFLISANQVKQGDTNIGLTKICLGTTSNFFVVRASSYGALLDGIQKLSKRDDIYVGSVTVEGNLMKPQAKIGDFCLYLRNE